MHRTMTFWRKLGAVAVSMALFAANPIASAAAGTMGFSLPSLTTCGDPTLQIFVSNSFDVATNALWKSKTLEIANPGAGYQQPIDVSSVPPGGTAIFPVSIPQNAVARTYYIAIVGQPNPPKGSTALPPVQTILPLQQFSPYEPACSSGPTTLRALTATIDCHPLTAPTLTIGLHNDASTPVPANQFTMTALGEGYRGTATLPAIPVNGTIPVQFTLTGLPSANASSFTVQLQNKTTLAEGQTFVLTAPPQTCPTLGNGVIQNSSNGVAQAAFVPPPTNVRIITDTHDPVCDTGCSDTIDSDGLVIAFNDSALQNGDHFNLYGTNLSKPKTDTRFIFYLPKTSSDTFVGNCYHLTTSRGTLESAPTKDLCPVAADLLHTITVPASYVRTELVGEAAADFRSKYNNGMNLATVGEYGADDKDCENSLNTCINRGYRVGLFYNLSALAGRQPIHVALTLHSRSDPGDKTYETPGNYQCGTQMFPANGVWWQGSPGLPIDLNDAYTFGHWQVANPYTIRDQPLLAFVQTWINHPGQNFGIVLRNDMESLNPGKEEYCVTHYDQQSLTVIYR